MDKKHYQRPASYVKPLGGRMLMAAASTNVGGTSAEDQVTTPDDTGWAKSHSLWEDDEEK